MKNRVIAKRNHQGNFTYFQTIGTTEQAFTAVDPNIWHQRMGHIGQKALKVLPNKTKGCETLGNNIPTCETCIQSKATTKVNRQPGERASQYLQTVHSDIWGPVKPLTWSKGRWYISFIDDYTRWATVSILTSKDTTYKEFLNWLTLEENQSGTKLKRFHTDNAKEYQSLQIKDTLQEKGILNTYAAPYAHEQNGIAEVFNRTILNKVRAMLLQAKLSHRYWGEALMATVYIYNRTPHSALEGFITPYEARHGKPPDILNIKIWGSKAYKRVPLEGLNKLSPRAKLGTLIGYGNNQYRVVDLSTHKATWTRDAYIIEGEYQPYNNDDPELSQETEPTLTNLGKEPDLVKDDNSWYNSFMDQMKDYAEESALPVIEEPNTYQQAQGSSDSNHWLEAMQKELNELHHQKTWELVKLPPGKKTLKGRWVYKLKQPPNGKPIYKARWVAKGFQQKPGVDFTETFANTVNPTTYRLLLAIAAMHNWEIEQWDVKSAYPNATLHDEVYIQQPTGFEDPKHPDLVCRCLKALYGLKQAAREWQQFLRGLLGEYNLKPLISDQGIYSHSTETLIVITYVDDLLVISDSKSKIDRLYNGLKTTITLNSLGPINTFLGIKVTRNRSTGSITLSQAKYAKRVLEKFNHPIGDQTKPLIPLGNIGPSQDIAKPETVQQYQREIGSLMYLMTKTRPDLAYPVGLCARFMANPGPEHFKALAKVWKYLGNTWNLSLTYQSESPISTYCDADWGGDIATRRSTTGFICTYRGAAISWNSRLQRTVALSSCEAEFMALKEAIKEQLFIASITQELQPLIGAIANNIIYTDSLSAIDLAKNPLHHHRTKHVDIQYYFVREKYLEGISQLTYIPTQQQIADGLTKSIDQQKWLKLLESLGLQRL